MPLKSESELICLLGEKRYILSVILSFLTEVDGTCTLITNRAWSKNLLPIFHVPHHLLVQNGIVDDEWQRSNNGTKNERRLRKQRHRFIPLPIQCPVVLLDRLNTTRLKKRIDYKAKTSYMDIAYPSNMSTDEIAWYEWTKARQDFATGMTKLDKNFFQNDSHLQLLRYRTSSYLFKNNMIPMGCSIPPKILGGATVLVSYPRSGNTLLRSLLERTTSIITGSDTRPDRTLSKALSTLHSLVGEGITNQKQTPVIKTHFPERKGYMMYNASRVILLVRNPYDAIDSYWNMCCTNTHTESVAEEVYDKFREKFRDLAQAEMVTWSVFHKYWLERCNTTFQIDDESSNKPQILLIRFEDLVQNTQSTMEEVIHFMTEEDCTTRQTSELHPFWKMRIRCALGIMDDKSSSKDVSSNEKNSSSSNGCIDTSKLGSYAPRSLTSSDKQSQQTKEKKPSSIGKSIVKGRYSDVDLQNMHTIAKNKGNLHHHEKGEVQILRLLGYDIKANNFPSNFANEEKEQSWNFIYAKPTSKEISVVRVNQGLELRPTGSPYGRAMTRWRRSHTNEDTEPFPIKSK